MSGSVAVARIEKASPFGEPDLVCAWALQLGGDPPLDLRCPLIDQRADVVAGRLAPVAEGDRAPDLAQGSPARPGGPGRTPVGPWSRRRSAGGRWRSQSQALDEAVH